ncbi:MAG: transcriptional regulator [Actinobacteria bacterium]|nr:transcriptional regulator [Actinomycetota bacterium]
MTEVFVHPAGAAAATADEVVRLSLLRAFEVRRGGRVIDLPLSAQRLVAFLAIHHRPLRRGYVAGTLWPDLTEERAAGNLRSALWRVRQPGVDLVEATPSHLKLAENVEVDLRLASCLARRVIDLGEGAEVLAVDEDGLSGDVLPDWYDEWVPLERERFRQVRLHALETLCDRLAGIGRYAEAVQAGLAAVSGEPLRESAQRALVKAYLAEGNPGEAIRQYRRYRTLLHDELGLEPSPLMEDLVVTLPV